MLQKAVNAIGSEWRRYLVSTCQTAMFQIVDDPVEVQDTYDLDGDGSTSDTINRFVHWWFEAVKYQTQVNVVAIPAVQAFINQMASFRDYAYCTYSGDSDCGPTAGILEKLDYKWTASDDLVGPPVAVDGVIAGFLRALYPYGEDYRTSHWFPGPDIDVLNNWYEEDCDDESVECSVLPDSSGYDDIDGLSDYLIDVVYFLNELLTGGNLSLNATWDAWAPYFYDWREPESEYTYYYEFGEYIVMLQELRAQVEAMPLAGPAGMPACDEGNWDTNSGYFATPTSPTEPVPPPIYFGALDRRRASFWDLFVSEAYAQTATCISCAGAGASITYFGSCLDCATNWPCRTSTGCVTSDSALDCEKPKVLAAIDELIERMTNFRNAMRNMGEALANAEPPDGSGWTDRGIVYTWEDARGVNRAQVDVSNFKIPKLKKKKTGNFLKGKVCIYIKHRDDEDDSPTWVRVTRTHPAATVAPFGQWNPQGSIMTKTSRAGWSYNRVFIKRTYL
jgi:hypothetical protein